MVTLIDLKLRTRSISVICSKFDILRAHSSHSSAI